MDNPPGWVRELLLSDEKGNVRKEEEEKLKLPQKKLMNEANDVVEDFIFGYLDTNEEVVALDGLPDIRVLLRRSFPKDERVALISGGGSGHEPAHAGYVGRGMLTAAVLGGVFASPSVDAVLAAIRACTGPPGCLLIVKNYTGDRLNFGLAAEIATGEGYKVEMVVTGDDAALDEKGITGRRGVAGTIFVHKCAGALAERGATLPEVKKKAQEVAARMGTMGVALSTCTLPGQGCEMRIGAAEVEMGLGIHGEAGMRRKVEGLDSLIGKVVERILSEETKYMPMLPAGSEVALLVNNLGGSTQLEMDGVLKSAKQYIESRRSLTVARVMSGTFMSALDMAGFSLTLLALDGVTKSLLDDACCCRAWHISVPRSSSSKFIPMVAPPPTITSSCIGEAGNTEQGGEVLKRCVEAACSELITMEAMLNQMDERIGDGDCGSTLARGAQEVLKSSSTFPWHNQRQTMLALGAIASKTMGGTSGALYSIFFTSMSNGMVSEAPWITGLRKGFDAIMQYGGARPGFRTMIDSLFPALLSLEANGETLESLEVAVAASQKGAEATKGMDALAGRSSYVPKEALESTADPGALAVFHILRAVFHILKTQ